MPPKNLSSSSRERPDRRRSSGRPNSSDRRERSSRRRRGLSHVGGAVELECADEKLAATLTRACQVSLDERSAYAHIHGFHSYPARLHPHTAAALISGLSAPGQRVLDPFCGSGTVLIEARRLGRIASGLDLNPLAVQLSAFKTQRIDSEFLDLLEEGARGVCAWAEERRLSRAGPLVRYGRSDRELFEIHVLLELDSLKAAIARIDDARMRSALSLVLSSILVKVSLKPGDTVEGSRPKRLRSGHTIQLFADRTRELKRRLLEYDRSVAPSAPAADVRQADARKLPLKKGSINLIVSSPPYPGVYDYAHHHVARMRWLGLDSSRLHLEEIGARRHYSDLKLGAALARYRQEFGACLTELRRVLEPGGYVAFVMADSALAGRAVRADRLISELGAGCGLTLVARASQSRPYFHKAAQSAFSQRARREHVLVLVRRKV